MPPLNTYIAFPDANCNTKQVAAKDDVIGDAMDCVHYKNHIRHEHLFIAALKISVVIVTITKSYISDTPKYGSII